MKQRLSFHSTAVLLALACVTPAGAQQPQAKVMIAEAVRTELAADRTDHAAFQYLDHSVTPDHDSLYYMVETPQGILKRKLQDHGKPIAAPERAADEAQIQGLLRDSAAAARQKRDSNHDDNQAELMLKLLPDAFLWTETAQHGDLTTLAFKPDPAYSPNSMEARVFAAMAGQLTLNTSQHRIFAMRGQLVEDVKFGFGIFGRLKKGGTFEIQRREVAPGHWQLTESHVHLDGKALFFKTIGSQEDEIRSEFKLSPAANLQEAYSLLPKFER